MIFVVLKASRSSPSIA